MKFLRAKRGQVMVLVAVSVTILLGFLGLATDMGVLWATRRRAQTAADAAAVAGVNATMTTQSSNYAAAATDVASINGFTNGSNSVVVTPTAPTPAGYPAGNYVQVNISVPVRTYFLGVLGYRTVNISVSALAGNTSGPNTVIALNGSGNGVTVDGPSVNVTCGVMSNSSSSSSLTVKNGGSIAAGSIGVVGGTSGSVPSNVKTGCAPVQNPFSNWTPPTAASCTRRNTNQTGTNTITTTTTVPTNQVYDGGSGNCGHSISNYNSRTHTYTPITVTFSGGKCGNHISCGGSSQPSCQNVTCNFSPGQYQCVNSSGGGGFGYAAPGFTYASAQDWTREWGDASIGFVRTGGLRNGGDQWGGHFQKAWFNSVVTPSIEIGPNASGCTANFSSGSYKFEGNV
jgi:hypothetical protein